jgi:hypothetical protein
MEDDTSAAAAALHDVTETFAATRLYDYANHVLLRFPIPALRAFCETHGGATDGDSLRQCALEITQQIAQKLQAYKLRPLRFVAPERYFGLCAAILDPDASPRNRLSEWQVPAFREGANRDAVVVDTANGQWWHSVAVVDVHGWPAGSVSAGLLHDAVVTCDDAPYRMIITHFGLVPRRVARDTARSAAAAADASHRAAPGIASGEEAIMYQAALNVRDDINEHNVGINVVLRVLVSAPTPKALTHARMAMDDAIEDCADTLTWSDGDQVRALLACLPTGTGCAITKR